jgi:NAD(P)H-hydrate epimerase
MLEHWPRARRIGILCGTGNNGGDGYVVAAQARQAGLAERGWAVAPPKSPAAIKACRAYEQAGGEIQGLTNASQISVDVMVDALLGTGLEREVTGDYARAIDAINAHPGPVLAIDIPSGLNADTGRVLGTAVRADATVTFIGMKLGLFTGRGQALVGVVLFDDLDVPPDIYSELVPAARRIRPDQDLLAGLARERDAHKGDCGRVVVIGGDTGMLGALQMCGVAAYRSGAGLVRVITRPEHAVAVTSGGPELLVTGSDDPAAVKRQLTDADAVAIGPGLGQGEWGKAMLSLALEWPGPLVIDADALNLLAADPVSREQWILTPHPGEAGRLLGSGAAKIQSDRVAAVREIARRFGGVALLKGSGTLVNGADDKLWVCDIGNAVVGGVSRRLAARRRRGPCRRRYWGDRIDGDRSLAVAERVAQRIIGMTTARIVVDNEEAMLALAESMAERLRPGQRVYLQGDLGAGKTRGHVKSPTYTLVEPYEVADMVIYHLDLYRLTTPEEIESVGIRDYMGGSGVCVVEWAERGEGVLPPPDARIMIHHDRDRRIVEIDCYTEVGHELCGGL